MDAAVALVAEPQEVVVAGDDLAGRPGEVDLEHRHVAAQIVDVEDEVLGELAAVPEDHPAHAERGQPELVAGGADRLDPGQPEVEDHLGRAERGEETAAGRVHVNVDVQAGVGLQLVQRLRHLLHRLVRAGVGDAEGRHDHDRVLVHPLQHRGGIHGVVAMGHRDLAHLDIPVAGELVPDHLDRAAHHVGPVRRLALGPAPGPPPPLGRHPRQHARLGGADGRGTHRVGRLGRIPQVSHHMHAPPFDLGGLRVLVSVDHVLIDRQRHQGMNLGFLPRLAERGQVLPRVPVEHHLVRHQLERVPGQRPVRREPVLGDRLGHVPIGKQTVRKLVTDGLTVVQ